MQENKSPHRGCAQKIRKLKSRYPEMSNGAIAKRVGCSTANVSCVLAKYLGDFGEDDLAQYKENKADVWDSLAMRAVLSITSKKLEKSSAAQLSIIAGTAFDKSQISRGQATGINVVALLDVVEAIRAQDSGGNRPAQVIEAADVVARF